MKGMMKGPMPKAMDKTLAPPPKKPTKKKGY